MNRTKIEWCDSTWNPVTGCRHGCPYCYAEKIANRFGEYVPDLSGYPDNHGGCHIVENKIKGNPYPYLFEPTFHPYRLKEPGQKTKPQTIFVCSMADLFGDWVPDEWIEEVFAACGAAPQHRYLFLTKNQKRYAQLSSDGKLPRRRERPNFWYGTSVTRAGDAAFTVGVRLNTFLSIEPLLEPLNAGIGSFGGCKWIIIGAESGNRNGRIVPEKAWVDNICEAAALTHIPVYMKDSLIPIMGEEHMRREFPWNRQTVQNAAGFADPGAAQETLQTAT